MRTLLLLALIGGFIVVSVVSHGEDETRLTEEESHDPEQEEVHGEGEEAHEEGARVLGEGEEVHAEGQEEILSDDEDDDEDSTADRPGPYIPNNSFNYPTAAPDFRPYARFAILRRGVPYMPNIDF
ncbi:uncharacterized protein [Drosophila tropicalis]|uniref:uncharacterized protein n=1 Tax=Drosophila tropicalis TaxID=46794 RepID=UPI0035AC0D12